MRFAIGAWLLCSAATGCGPTEYATPRVGSEHVGAPESSSSEAARGADEPTRADDPPRRAMVALPVPEHVDAVVVVPDRPGPRPLLVAAHGAGDRAEWHCEVWSSIVRGRGFILCPQGRRVDNRVPHADSIYYYPNHHVLDRELTAALAALASRYPDRVDTTGAVYAGFSQGAIFGALIITDRPATFPRAILVEGGHGHYGEWNRASARAYKRGGGRRIFFACGGHWCNQNAHGIEALLRQAGVEARVGYAEGAGHTMLGGVEKHLAEGFEWAVRDDARWK